jgi:phosphoenolpyruvate carboxylase
VRDRLWTTRELLYYCLGHPGENVLATLTRGGGYTDSGPLMADLALLHRSLIETRDERIANGPVLNAIRQVQTFGSALMRLDIRQESARHREVMNAITEHLELGSFNEWPEERKVVFLEKELKACATAAVVVLIQHDLRF